MVLEKVTLSQREDFLFWKLESSGLFSVKSALEALQGKEGCWRKACVTRFGTVKFQNELISCELLLLAVSTPWIWFREGFLDYASPPRFVLCFSEVRKLCIKCGISLKISLVGRGVNQSWWMCLPEVFLGSFLKTKQEFDGWIQPEISFDFFGRKGILEFSTVRSLILLLLWISTAYCLWVECSA